ESVRAIMSGGYVTIVRLLLVEDGAAKYLPYFGHLTQTYPRLPPIDCDGGESTLADCRGWNDRGTNMCRMGADAAVQCFSQGSGNILI
ncbi:hypothetical protein LSH36_895g00014, partial [Paralvinella palmiformis]